MSGATFSATPQKKSITPLRVVDTQEGSRVTITSDAPLNDYSAYRSGNRFFVVIPQADAPRLLSALRGRGFDDVQVQKRGTDVVLSFRLQPGTTARVDQKFNRLEIVFNAPGTTSAGTTKIDIKPPLLPPVNNNTINQNITTVNQNGSIAPPTTDNATTAAGTSTGGRRGGRRNRGSGYGDYSINEYPDIPVASDGSTTQTEIPAPSPGASVAPSPLASPSVAPSATPVEQIAQTQTAPPAPQSAVTNTSNQTAPESRTLGATLRQNWLLVLLGALVLVVIGLVLATRSRGDRRASDTAATATTTIKEKNALKDAPATRSEAVSPGATAAAVAVPVATAAAVEKSSAVKRAPEPEEVESKEIAPSVNVERADAQVNSLLAGEKYDEAVIGTSDTGTRQIIAAGLLAALAGRNEERRERAREAFVKHDYFDEATRDLRTASAAGERASAARSLGLARDPSATPHLVAALEDRSPEVRRATVEALADLRDPEALAPLQALLEREKDRKVPRGLIRRAIEASTPAKVAREETPTAETAHVVAEAVVAPPVEEPARVQTEEVTAETVRPPSVETTEAPSVETATQPGALDTVPEPAKTETGASPVAAADLSSTESTIDPGTLAAATPIALAGASGLADMAARRRAEKEEERRRAEEERQRAEEEAQARKRAQEEEARRALEARVRAEEEARRRAEEERQRAEQEATRKRAEEEARQRAEAEAARKRAEEEARQQAEEQARRRAEEEATARKLAEEEARQRAEEEARRKAEEEARIRAEKEARARAEEEEARRRRAEAERQRVEEEAQARQRAQEEEARRRAEEARIRAEEEARQRAEVEARQRAEEERRQAEEARRAEEARLRAEEEARQREAEAARQRAEEEARARAEEARQRAEEDRRRAEEEAARQRAEAEAARVRAEEEAESARAEAELSRLRAEAEATRLRSEEELARRQVIQPDVAASLVDPNEVKEIAPSETASLDVVQDSLIERNDGTAAGWVEVDISEPEIVRHATPIKQSPAAPVEQEKSIAEVSPEPIMAEPMPEPPAFFQQSAPEAVAPELGDEPRAASPTKEIDAAISDKGIAPVGEDLSTVPSAILKRLSSEDDNERATAVADLGRLGGDDSFREITAAFDDPAPGVRDAAARSLYNLQSDRAASFTRALREAPPERRRAIGAALASSGLANEAIGHLMGESREKTYDAFSLLFLMSKAGEVQPLLRAIEDHPNNEVRLAVVKLLALSGQQEILPAFRRLAVRGSLPTEVRSAVMEAIYQISSQSSPDASSAA